LSAVTCSLFSLASSVFLAVNTVYFYVVLVMVLQSTFVILGAFFYFLVFNVNFISFLIHIPFVHIHRIS
jgi:hypothetical protein